MSNGWDSSAQAWIESMGERGERGDWGRQHVLDPVMMDRVKQGRFNNAIDVGCGEGRFCRMLKAAGVQATGIEMARVLRPGGALLMANLTGFTSACADRGWVKDASGEHLHFPVDDYLRERPVWLEWSGIRIENWHRPLAAYMTAFLDAGLALKFFDEPAAISGAEIHQERQRRVPWFVVMEWEKPS